MWEQFKRFSPKYSDLPSMISNINVLLRLLTLNVDSKFKKPIFLGSYLLTGICMCSYVYGYHFSLVWFLVWRKQNSLAAMMVFGSLGVSSSVATTKLCYMIARGSKLRCLVDQYIESNDDIKPDTRFARHMAEILQKVKIRGVSFWIFVMSISVTYLTVPAFLPGKHMPEDLLVFYGLEPPFETPYFQISYIIMFFSVNFICYITSTICTFIIIIVGYIEAQMMCLSQEVLCIWDDSIQDIIEFKLDMINAFPTHNLKFDNQEKKKINSRVRERLINIVQNHSRIIQLLKNVNNFFNIPNAVAFCCLGVSLIAELLGGLENTYMQVPFTFVQVAMDCYTGQKIMDASDAFEKAVYACKWENFDRKNREMVLLILQNSQKTLTVSAGSMVVMNLSCMMNIIRTVYSSYTTLRSMI